MNECFDGSDALRRLRFAGCTEFVTTIGVKFVRIFSEEEFDTFAELRFGFGSSGISIGEAFLAEVIDGSEYFIEPRGSIGNFLCGKCFGHRPSIVGCSRLCHGDEGKSSREVRP